MPYRSDMSLTSILSAEAIEKAVKDCEGRVNPILKKIYTVCIQQIGLPALNLSFNFENSHLQ